MEAIRADDQGAFRILYERHWKALYTKACKNVNEDEAKDMIQEIMISFWNRRKQITITQEEDVSKYLFTALKYKTISFYANTAAQVKRSDFFEALLEVSPDLVFEGKELNAILYSAIETMPEKMQQIFRMSREEEISIADIAAQLNLSEQTVKNQISNALKRLRAIVLDHQTGDWVIPVLALLYTSRMQ